VVYIIIYVYKYNNKSISLQLYNQNYNLIFIPTFLAIFLLKYVKSKSVNVVVESKKKDDEKIIFLSNSVILAFEYGLNRIIKNIITKYFSADCMVGKYFVTELK
jgi:hypothetical protein